MGSLVPNPSDMEVINGLNSVFSDPHLTALRNWMKAAGNDPDFFGAGRSLHRISYRLKIHPVSGAGTNPRGRWFKFLQSFLTERPGGSGQPTNHEIIRSGLEGFVKDPHCTGIHFWARYGAASEIPSGIAYKAVVAQEVPDTVSGLYWGSITLLCRHDLSSAAGTIADPSKANGGDDTGENGQEQPNL